MKRYYGTRLYHRTICSQRLTKSKPVDARSKEQTLFGLLTKEADRSWLFAKKHNKSLWSCAWFVWYVTISTQKWERNWKGTKLFPADHLISKGNHTIIQTRSEEKISRCVNCWKQKVQRKREKKEKDQRTLPVLHSRAFSFLFPTIVFKYTRLMRTFSSFFDSCQQEPRHSTKTTSIFSLDRRDDFLLLNSEVSHSCIKQHHHHI